MHGRFDRRPEGPVRENEGPEIRAGLFTVRPPRPRWAARRQQQLAATRSRRAGKTADDPCGSSARTTTIPKLRYIPAIPDLEFQFTQEREEFMRRLLGIGVATL